MKKSFALLLATTVLTAPVLAYKQQDLDMFKLLNSCEKCDLSEANLSKADLSGANLSGADLTDTDLTGANLKNVEDPKFCRTKTSIGLLNPDCRD